jgi:hypothetical protein
MVGNLQSLGYAPISDGPIACLICRHQQVPDARLLPVTRKIEISHTIEDYDYI